MPFVHHHRDLDGKNYLCSYSTSRSYLSTAPLQDIKSNKERQKIQNNILQGIPVTNCEYCYKLEREGSISPRIKETIEFTRNTIIKQNLEDSAISIDKAKVLSYDIFVDNQCNLACIGCGPKWSSLWAQQKGIEIINQINLEDFNELASSQRVFFAGGEPLINNHVYNLLCQIASNNQQPAVIISSNIASIEPKFFEVLKKIKNLSITVSIDGYKLVNEYHRWPLNWPEFYENLKRINEMKIFISWNTVIDAVSIWGIADLIKIESLTTSWNLSVLDIPDCLNLKNLPDNLKLQAMSQLDALMASKFFTQMPTFKDKIALAKSRLEMPGDPSLLARYVMELDQQRKLSHENYLGVKLT